MPLKITLCREMESNTGTFCSNFHVFTDHNEFRKRKNSHVLAFLTLGQTSNTGKQGELFIVHFTSEADESRASVYLRAICSLLSDLVTVLVKAGTGQSRILPSQQILAGSSGEE